MNSPDNQQLQQTAFESVVPHAAAPINASGKVPKALLRGVSVPSGLLSRERVYIDTPPSSSSRWGNFCVQCSPQPCRRGSSYIPIIAPNRKRTFFHGSFNDTLEEYRRQVANFFRSEPENVCVMWKAKQLADDASTLVDLGISPREPLRELRVLLM